MNPAGSLWWYLARSSGIVAALLLVASVLWGLLSSTRMFRGRITPAWLLDLHRWLGTLTVGFTIVHLAALWADDYLEFDPATLLVPFLSEWRPAAVALGIGAFYLIVAVQATSRLRSRIPRRVWRIVHLGSFPALWLVFMHAGLAGSDTGHPLYRLGLLGITGMLVFTVTYRVLTAGERRPGRRAATGSA